MANAAGRRSAQGRAASSWAPTRTRVASSNGAPVSIVPTGRPSSLQCSGSEMLGRPVTLPKAVKQTELDRVEDRLLGSGVLRRQDRAGGRRQDRRGRRQQQVEVAAPAGDFAAREPLQLLHRGDVFIGADPLGGGLVGVAVVRLDLLPVDPVVVGDAADRHRHEVRRQLLRDRPHLDLGHLVAQLLEQGGGVAGRRAADRGRSGRRAAPPPSGRCAVSPTSAPTSSAKGRRGAGALYQASGSGPEVTSSVAAASAIVRVIVALDHGAHPGLRPPRDPPAAALQADQAAVGGGNADRATAVVGVGDREHAAGHRRRGPARGTAGGAAGVPGVERVAEARVLGHGERPELGRVGAAAEDEAGPLQRLDHQLALLAEALRRAVASRR